jgi:hypothetical protein
MVSDLRQFWASAHEQRNPRWVTSSDPVFVLSRLGVNLDGVGSVLDVGPGFMHMANHLSALGKRVVVHDIVSLDDPRFVPQLPLDIPVDIAIAHLVLQHVKDHRDLALNVMASLVPGGTFYFDAVAENCNNPGMTEEFETGTSFPFQAWDLVDTRKEEAGSPGYFFCKATRT